MRIHRTRRDTDRNRAGAKPSGHTPNEQGTSAEHCRADPAYRMDKTSATNLEKPRCIHKKQGDRGRTVLEQIHSDKRRINKSSIPRTWRRRSPIPDGSKPRRQTPDEQDIRPPPEIRDSEQMKANHRTQTTDVDTCGGTQRQNPQAHGYRTSFHSEYYRVSYPQINVCCLNSSLSRKIAIKV